MYSKIKVYVYTIPRSKVNIVNKHDVCVRHCATKKWSACIYICIIFTSKFPTVKTRRDSTYRKKNLKSPLPKLIPLNQPDGKEKLFPSPKCFPLTYN